MASIFDDPTKTPSGSLTKLTATVGQRGVTTFLTKTYPSDDVITESFYGGLENDIQSNEIPFGFGRQLITGQVTNKNVIRSDLDPSQLKAVIQFITGEGPVKGVIGVGEGKLKNVLVGGKTVTTTTTGGSSNVGFKEILGSLAGTALTMGAMTYVKDFLSNKDPVTGEVLPNNAKPVVGDNKSISSSSIKDFNLSDANDWDTIRYNKALKKWVTVSEVDLFKASKIGLTPYKVYKDGLLINGDVDSVNYIGAGVTVTDVGGPEKRVNITIAAATTPTPDPEPGGGAVSSCLSTLAVTAVPISGYTYSLKRNGEVVSVLKIVNNSQTIVSVASTLATKTVIPNYTKGKKFTIAASGANITITGDTTCKSCDIGEWTLDQFASNNTKLTPSQTGTGSNTCAIKRPSLTV